MAGLKRVKAKEGENLTPANIKRVIDLLENPETKTTKKQACEILNISYNTARLDSIIANYKEELERNAKHRASNRGKPATEYEIAYCIENYLKGDPITDICKRLYRPAYFVKNILLTRGVPLRQPGANYTEGVELVPEEAMKDSFKVGETVYSMRYHTLAKIRNIYVDLKKQTVYGLYLMSEATSMFAYQPAWELASLEHLKQYGVNFE
jgi:hypothetical protein